MTGDGFSSQGRNWMVKGIVLPDIKHIHTFSFYFVFFFLALFLGCLLMIFFLID